MIQGIHTAVQGMTSLMQKQDQIANNLANINTTGFKQSGVFTKAYHKYLDNDERKVFANRQLKTDEVFIDYREGPMKKTGATLDLMIKGSGFFTVMTPNGVRYTRNGNFSLDDGGYLVTADGYRVLGKDEYIKFDELKHQIMINEDGEVFHGEESRGRLRIADFKKPYRLVREGNSLFRPQLPDNPEVQSPGFAIQQGYLEGSNSNVVKNMVEMISAFRNYEADQKALHAQNETLDKAVNQVGRVG
ncbi:MAG: flagellar basal-body rod protein FlgF [Chitinivibrionales bacterium]|nr:flagellar basal-body rod protein FlgF [Chitinivibrionales bacterium]MBD3395989.1 flagellar basal-body rod protein FlgF [Chitinivibrionales bacterium]